MCQAKTSYVTSLLEGYPDMQRKIAVLRYELEHPAVVSPDEMIEALSFARGDSEGHGSGHISNKTMYIAMNYQSEAARQSSGVMDEIVSKLIPLEQEMRRLDYYVSLLEKRQEQVVRLHYFESMPWEVLSKQLGTTSRTAQKIRNEALDKLAAMYSLV